MESFQIKLVTNFIQRIAFHISGSILLQEMMSQPSKGKRKHEHIYLRSAAARHVKLGTSKERTTLTDIRLSIVEFVQPYPIPYTVLIVGMCVRVDTHRTYVLIYLNKHVVQSISIYPREIVSYAWVGNKYHQRTLKWS